MLDYRIHTFLVLCECMNYRRAAEILHISQPAVTQQIHHLEQLYHQKLFNYEKHKLQLTEAGILLEQYARSASLHEQGLMEKLADPAVRRLRVGATKTIGNYVLREDIRRYLCREDQSLTLIVDNTKNLLQMLEENQLDFAVVEGYFDHAYFDNQLLKKEPFVGICPKGHPFAGREVTFNELFRETIIHREEGSGTLAILEQKLRSYNESLDRFRRKICISSFPVILDLVKHGFGVSFVYQVLADSDPDVAQFAIQGEPIVREFNIVYLKHADLREKISWFFPERM